MTGKIRRCEKEIEEAVFKIDKKYGYEDLGVTGTIDPKWYKRHLKSNHTPGMVIQFMRYESK